MFKFSHTVAEVNGPPEVCRKLSKFPSDFAPAAAFTFQHQARRLTIWLPLRRRRRDWPGMVIIYPDAARVAARVAALLEAAEPVLNDLLLAHPWPPRDDQVQAWQARHPRHAEALAAFVDAWREQEAGPIDFVDLQERWLDPPAQAY